MQRHLITSAIPYINGVKHLGNLIGSQLPADLYARYQRARGNEVLFLCATDEHGTPAELAAAKANQDISEYNAKIDYIFQYASNTIGIGDGGNEIGMGNLSKEIKKVEGLPDNPAVTKVDSLIISSCSNWGAFGLICAISEIKSINLLPTIEEAKNLIIKSVDLGAVEGLSGEKKYAVDGRNMEDDSSCLLDLHNYLKARSIL